MLTSIRPSTLHSPRSRKTARQMRYRLPAGQSGSGEGVRDSEGRRHAGVALMWL